MKHNTFLNLKSYTLLFITGFILFNCKNKSDSDVKHLKLEGDIINDSIYTRMPGQFFSVNQYLIWIDPFNSKNYIHIIDLKSKDEIQALGTIGQGPNEFSTPTFSLTYNNQLFIYDENEDKQAILDIDSAITGKEKYTFLNETKQDMTSRKINIGKDKYVELNPASNEYLFCLTHKNYHFAFGKPFIHDSIENCYDIYQGEAEFNIDRNKLVYTNFIFPYLAIFDYNDKNKKLTLNAETTEKFNYQLSNYTLQYNREKKGCMGLTLSKDFIILLKRDYTTDDVNEDTISPGQFDKLPKTVFLYDYAGELKYIADLGIPILRICSDIKSNTLYVIGVNPEYMIMKYDLNIKN